MSNPVEETDLDSESRVQELGEETSETSDVEAEEFEEALEGVTSYAQDDWEDAE